MEARQASVEGGGSRVMLRVLGAGFVVAGLVTPLLMIFGESTLSGWESALVGVGVLVIFTPVGAVLWSTASQAKHDMDQLRAHGRPAVAEILALKVTPGDGGEADTVELTVRIRGAGGTFEASYRDYHRDWHRVGTRVDAVVDPADRLFDLGRPGARESHDQPG